MSEPVRNPGVHSGSVNSPVSTRVSLNRLYYDESRKDRSMNRARIYLVAAVFALLVGTLAGLIAWAGR
jgi:hypothetical protein